MAPMHVESDTPAELATTEPVAQLVKRGPGRPSTLTPAMGKTIVERIMLGRFAWVAAVGSGCTPATYYRWMARGEKEYAAHEAEVARREDHPTEEPLPDLTIYASFWYDVTVAKAFARGVAEVKVAKDNPLAWLNQGPGRDKPGAEGWSTTNKMELTGANGGPITVAPGGQQYDLKNLSAEQLEQWDRLLTAAAQGAAQDGESGEGAP